MNDSSHQHKVQWYILSRVKQIHILSTQDEFQGSPELREKQEVHVCAYQILLIIKYSN